MAKIQRRRKRYRRTGRLTIPIDIKTETLAKKAFPSAKKIGNQFSSKKLARITETC
jgi:hypothetical protein